MRSITQQLYRFLSSCGGNWRNTLYIRADDQNGCLMAADREGRPVLMGLGELCELSGERIDPSECRGQLEEGAFQDIFAQYLLWQLPSADEHPARALCRREYETQQKEVFRE